VFGIIRPCQHRLGGELGAVWRAHLCGMCLSLRDDHGQAARLATNYDGLVISVLAEAQAEGAPGRRTAGPCALRGMRRADVAVGDGARLAATVSLALAALMTESLAVGRATLREGLRLLETQGVLVIRPGPGGGPVLRETLPDDLASSMTLMLQSMRVSFLQVVEARTAIEPQIAG